MKRFKFKEKHTYSKKIKIFAVLGILLGFFCFRFTNSQITNQLSFGIITITGYIALKLHLKNMSKVISELIFLEGVLEISFVNKIRQTYKLSYANLELHKEVAKIIISDKDKLIGYVYKENLLSEYNWDEFSEKIGDIQTP